MKANSKKPQPVTDYPTKRPELFHLYCPDCGEVAFCGTDVSDEPDADWSDITSPLDLCVVCDDLSDGWVCPHYGPPL
jgi:hypothetical protein